MNTSNKTQKDEGQKTKSALKFFKRHWVPITAGLLLMVPLLLMSFVGSLSPKCDEHYRQDTTISINGQQLKAEVANTTDSRTQGLSGRQCISRSTAMLFEFDQPGYYNFWMKDMNFAIDIIWLDENKKVVTVKPNIPPRTYPQTYTSSTPAQYVIELKAGQAKNLGLEPGKRVTF